MIRLWAKPSYEQAMSAVAVALRNRRKQQEQAGGPGRTKGRIPFVVPQVGRDEKKIHLKNWSPHDSNNNNYDNSILVVVSILQPPRRAAAIFFFLFNIWEAHACLLTQDTKIRMEIAEIVFARKEKFLITLSFPSLKCTPILCTVCIAHLLLSLSSGWIYT